MADSSITWKLAIKDEFPRNHEAHAIVYQAREWDELFRSYGHKTAPLICLRNRMCIGHALVFRPRPYKLSGLAGIRSRLNLAVFPELVVLNGPRAIDPESLLDVHRSFAKMLPGPTLGRPFRERVHARQLRVDHPNAGQISAFYREAGFEIGTAFTFQLNLEKTIEELWRGVHPKKRNRVNRARRDGLMVREVQGLEGMREYYNIRLQTWRRNGLTEVPFEHFEQNWNLLGNEGLLRTFISSVDGVDLAGQNCFFSSDLVQLSGVAVADANFEGKHPGNELLQWHIIEAMKEAGGRLLDYGGATPNAKDSKQKGIHSFKASWGGELVEHFEFERQNPGWRTRLYKSLSKSNGELKAE